MSCAVGSGRVAEMPNTEMPSSAPVASSAASVSATKRAIDTSGAVSSPGNCIVGESPSGPADVVVEDLVEAEADGLGGQVDLVLADLGLAGLLNAAVP